MPRPTDDINLLTLDDVAFQAAIARKGISGTDLGALLGLDRYRSPQDVWNAKMGVAPPTPDAAPLRRGRAMESVIAGEYQRATGHETWEPGTFICEDVLRERAGPRLHDGDQVVHREIPWWRGSPDRFITDRAAVGILEIKCLGRESYERTLLQGVAPHYWAQLQWYLGAADLPWGAFAIFHADSWRLYAVDVERDDVFLADAAEAASTFWHQHVLTRTPPGTGVPIQVAAGVSESTFARARQTAQYSTIPEGDDELRALLRELRTIRRLWAETDAERDAIETRVRAAMQTRGMTHLRAGDGLRLSLTETTRTTTDWAAFRRAHPGLPYDQFTRRSASTTLRVTLPHETPDPESV